MAATYWFDPAETATEGPVVIRFTGHRKGVGAKTRPGDQFVQDELVEDVRPDDGSVSVTTRVRAVNAGEWVVSAAVLSPGAALRGARSRASGNGPRLHPGGWSWRTWSFRKQGDPPLTVRTRVEPFAHVPGVVPLVWGVLALLGFVVALVTQQAVLARIGLPAAGAFAVSLFAIAAGLVGAQLRFLIDHRRERRFGGWAVQGFLAATALAGVPALLVAGIPPGPFIDASAPGIFLGLAIGRVGCFFAGCCTGRSSSRGLWSSDQRVGRRRIPTQLLESALSAGVALVALAAIEQGVPLRGGLFVGALATYTLVRQGILSLRAERPGGGRGVWTAAAALAVLIADLLYLLAWPR